MIGISTIVDHTIEVQTLNETTAMEITITMLVSNRPVEATVVAMVVLLEEVMMVIIDGLRGTNTTTRRTGMMRLQVKTGTWLCSRHLWFLNRQHLRQGTLTTMTGTSSYDEHTTTATATLIILMDFNSNIYYLIRLNFFLS